MLKFQQFTKHPQLLKLSAVVADFNVQHPDFNRLIRGNEQREILSLSKQANIMVFDREIIEKFEPQQMASMSDDEFLKLYSLPFRTVWIEMMDDPGHILVSLNKQDLNKDKKGRFAGFLGALIHEKAPMVFDIYCLEMLQRDEEEANQAALLSSPRMFDNKDGGKEMMGVLEGLTEKLREQAEADRPRPFGTSITCYLNVDIKHMFTGPEPCEDRMHSLPGLALMYHFSVMNRMFKAFHDGRPVTEITSATLPIPTRIKKGKQKYDQHPVKQFVRIVLKNKDRETVKPITPGGTVEWTHRWEKVGHWRRVHGIGKDREGVYQVPGLTWVRETVCGPEDKPLVKKTRFYTDKSRGEAG